MGLYHKLLKLKEDPLRIIPYLQCHIRTSLFKLGCILMRKRIRWGKGLRITGKLSVKGSGYFYLGNNVTIGMKVTPWTYDKNAVITIADNVYLNGTRFACKKSISIDSDCIIGECRIMDTSFHSIEINRHDTDAYVKTEAVHISKNVWIAPDAVILPGITIGENSVVGICSVVTKDIPEDSLVAGNPAQLVKKLEN